MEEKRKDEKEEIRIERKRIGNWEMKTGSERSIQKEIVGKLEIFLDEWKKVVWDINCPWWSVENLGIQSPLVRIDMAPVDDSNVNVKNFVYEVEVRPAGIGLALSLFSKKKRVKQWREALSICNGFVNIQSSIQDDGLAAEILKIPYYYSEDEKISIDRDNPPYWIRTNKRKGQLVEDLEKISLVPIRLDGDKGYLVKLGMAEKLTSRYLCYLSQLKWRKPFVVKPLIGTRMVGVEIFLPNFLKKEFGQGGSTQTRVKKVIESAKSAKIPYIVQKFISPQIEVIDGVRGCTIWRLFFTWEEEKYKFAGGLWNWRPNIRVHGSSDSVFGTVDL